LRKRETGKAEESLTTPERKRLKIRKCGKNVMIEAQRTKEMCSADHGLAEKWPRLQGPPKTTEKISVAARKKKKKKRISFVRPT